VSLLSAPLDQTDRQIVRLLLEDGRLSAAAIARRLGSITPRSVRFRIERLRRAGVISISAIVNPRAIGYDVIADVILEVAPGRVQPLGKVLRHFDNVSYVAGSLGDGDLSIQVYARSTAELARFVDEVVGSLPGVTRVRTTMVPWKLKDVYQWDLPSDLPGDETVAQSQLEGGGTAAVEPDVERNGTMAARF
jgi:Lrp/AsnC family transcriptional regulator for asnA, asnC and gidA